MTTAPRNVVYDFAASAPQGAIDGSEELLSEETRAEQHDDDPAFKGLFAGPPLNRPRRRPPPSDT